ncbi:Zinc finger and BTB domain-containing protein 48 [Zootermopsis nevadensis]|uniref:Zinc finger and BTB domain-containing protein 48 n=1 Tax=Zootermopsis nevadensis TaxID=136037 RepID=A0A067RFI9_ZOONE|nr:Zinc finger and BTB domain-containing protein 48 [Zootermopsis nevadensis]
MRGIFAGLVISTQSLSYVYQFEGVSPEDDIQLHFCQLCGKSYKSRSTRNRHLRYECGIARFKLECSVCGRRFSRPDNLRQHAGIHMPGYLSYSYKASSNGGSSGVGGGNFQTADGV